MKRLATRFTALLSLVVVVGSLATDAEARDDDIPVAAPGKGITIFMDISAAGRKGRAAKRMTELHEKYYSKGWVVIDVEPYLENSDLEGFFITYVGRENVRDSATD